MRPQTPRIVDNKSGADLQVPLGRVAYRREPRRGASEMLATCITVSDRFDGLVPVPADLRIYRRLNHGSRTPRVFNRLWPVCP